MSHTTYRNRHLRALDEHSHFGDLPATLAALSEGIDTFPEGMTLEDVLREIDAHLQRLEDGNVSVDTFTMDAFVLGYCDIHAVKQATMSGSFSLDAVFPTRYEHSLSIDAKVAHAFTINAITVGLTAEIVDDKHAAPYLLASTISLSSDITGWTYDPTDGGYSSSPYSSHSTGWVVLVVPEPTRLRIDSYGSLFKYASTDTWGSYDAKMAIWGPRSTPPENEAPWHISDDAGRCPFPFCDQSTTASLHERGDDPDGTLYGDGSTSSDDIYRSGLPLEVGTYWVSIWPYSSSYHFGTAVINFEVIHEGSGSFSIDALTTHLGTHTLPFTADAVFFQPTFSIDAVISKTVTIPPEPSLLNHSARTAGWVYDTEWEHVPGDEAMFLVVFAGTSATASDITSITYGNKPLTLVRTVTGNNDAYQSWILEDLDGRDDDMVRLTQSGSATYSVFTMTFGRVPASYVANGYASMAKAYTRTAYVTVSTAVGPSIPPSVIVFLGYHQYYASYLTTGTPGSEVVDAYGGYPGFVVRTVPARLVTPTPASPGYSWPIWVGSAYNSYYLGVHGLMFSHPFATLAFTIDAILRPSITADAWKILGGVFTMGAFVGGYVRVDALIAAHHFMMDARIPWTRDPLWDAGNEPDAGPYGQDEDGEVVGITGLSVVDKYERYG